MSLLIKIIIIYVILALYFKHTQSCVGPSCVGLNRNNNAQYASVLQSLEDMGYTIIEGNMKFLINRTDAGANPSSVYGVFQFDNTSGIEQTGLGDNGGEPIISWRPFSGCDAVLFIGCTPPKVKYFSFVPYIYQRFYPINNNSFVDIETLFASLGDSINNLVINSTDYNNWDISHDSNNNFNSLTTIITTADQQTFNDISSELNKIGLSKTVNLNSIPIDYINFVSYNETDIDKEYDYLSVLYRAQLPDNKTEYDLFLNRLQTVYYIKNDQCVDLQQPRITYPPFIRNTTTNYNEYDIYLKPFNRYKNYLISYFTQNLGYSFEIEYNFEQVYLGVKHYGFQCIDNGIDCWGDNRDAQYWTMSSSPQWYFFLDNNSIYILIGVNHQNLNITVYSNLAVYEIKPGSDPIPGPVITNFEYEGSAQILPIDIHNQCNYNYYQNLFVVQLSRPFNCINGIPGFCLSEYQWDKNNITTFTIRDYLNPISKTRPNHAQIIPPILLKFKIPTYINNRYP